MEIYILAAIFLAFFVYYIYELRKVRFSARMLARMAMFAAIFFVLHALPLLRLPQGGMLTPASMLPLLLAAAIFGPGAGMTTGLVAGLLCMVSDFFVVHPLQFLYDYIMPFMLLGLAGIFGTQKPRLALGSLLAALLAVGCNVLSGVVFFGEYVPEGMNIWLYSFSYNFGTVGLDAVIAIVVLMFLPVQKWKEQFTGPRKKR